MKANTFAISTLLLTILTFGGCKKPAAAADAADEDTIAEAAHDKEIGDPTILSVLNALLTGYNSTIIGMAFDHSFINPNWSTFTNDKGQTIVQFAGGTNYREMEKTGLIFDTFKPAECPAIETVLTDYSHNPGGVSVNAKGELVTFKPNNACLDTLPVVMVFQFMLSHDKKDFKIATLLFGTPKTSVDYLPVLPRVLDWIYS